MIERASGRAGITACALVALLTGACGDGTRPPSPDPSIGMLDPGESHYGFKYPDWAVEYMRWQFETAASVLWDVPDCKAGQDPESPVVFLEQDLATRTEPDPCAFGSDKAILFPLLSLASPVLYYTDSAMPPPSAESVLIDRVTDTLDDFDIQEATIGVDRRELRAPQNGLIEPTSYCYRPYPGDSLLYRQYGVTVYPDVIEPAVVAGYWVLLAPLPPGPHELSISIRGDLNGIIISSQFTYHLMVEDHTASSKVSPSTFPSPARDCSQPG